MMPAARGVKRAASKSSAAAASTSSTAATNKKKRGGAVHLEIPSAPKKRGRVFACGQGDVGQLGLGEDVTELTKFKHVAALGDKIVAVSAGGMHTIALDSSGKVWTYGCNDEGALGRNTNNEKDEGTPKKVTLPANAVAISAGDSHSAALLDDGHVYAWGSFRDSHGSMGLVVQGREGKPCRAPVLVEVGERAVAIASGSDHLVILTQTGSVYTMGCGEQGQLGRLAQRSASREARQGFSALLVPSKVTLKGGASNIWAGYHATFVLHAGQDKVYACGLNNYGQLGITGEKRRAAIYAPVECDAFRDVSARWLCVAAGQHHSLALSGGGAVHAVGRCEYGRLGLGEGTGDAEKLVPVPKLAGKKCVSISAGISNSFAVTDTGEVFAWGMGSEGQLGTGACADAVTPAAAACVALDSHTPAAVAAGGQHTVLLVLDPNAQKEASPEPESEPAEEKVEEASAEEEEEEQVEEKPRAKRQKKGTKEDDITSSSEAHADIAEEDKPQKVNGDDKDAAMEVDETDNKQNEDKTDDKPTTETEEKMETDTEVKDNKPDTVDTSSQETTDSETKSQDSQDSESQDSKSHDTKSHDSKSHDSKSHDSKSEDSKDVEMTEKVEMNGTEESEKVEAKTVDVIQSAPLTSTA